MLYGLFTVTKEWLEGKPSRLLGATAAHGVGGPHASVGGLRVHAAVGRAFTSRGNQVSCTQLA